MVEKRLILQVELVLVYLKLALPVFGAITPHIQHYWMFM
jgi:hypothetical protein